MNIIETDWKWTSRPAKRRATQYIALHHAAAVNCSAADVDRWHKEKGWAGIGYHYFVRKDGRIYRGRELDAVGAHVQGMNHISVGICAEGNYDIERTMSAAQMSAIKELLRELKKLYPSAEIVGHREIGESDCPGRYYPLQEMKTTYRNDEEKIDMDELEALKAEIAALTAKVDAAVNEMKARTTPMIYDYIDDNMPQWARDGVRYCIENGIITGVGDGKLGLDDNDLRYCTMIMRVVKALSICAEHKALYPEYT